MAPALIAVILIAVVLVVIIIKSIRIVPQKTEAIVERLGKYRVTLGAGGHLLVFKPFQRHQYGILMST